VAVERAHGVAARVQVVVSVYVAVERVHGVVARVQVVVRV
jgi:hypothetical protein